MTPFEQKSRKDRRDRRDQRDRKDRKSRKGRKDQKDQKDRKSQKNWIGRKSRGNRPGEEYRAAVANYIRYAMVVLVWCVLIFAATKVDETYQNQSGGFLTPIIDHFIRIGHEWGITYAFLYDALGGYSSILLTVMGMIVTGWMNLSDRLEKTVYGIRRRELLSNKWVVRCIVDSFIGVFITPAWMVYTLIRKYCFASYFILAMIFIEFLISNVMVASTYSSDQDYIRLRKKILYNLKKVSDIEDFDRFDDLMGRIGMSTGPDTDWARLETLFFDLMRRIERKEFLKAYRVGYAFVSKIYADRNQEQLIELTDSYVQKINQEDRRNDGAEWERQRMVLWVLLDCVYQNCTEEQIEGCMDMLFDSLALNRMSNKGMYPRLTIAEMEDIFAMAALQTEYWLQRNNSMRCSFGQKSEDIFRKGRAVFLAEERRPMLLWLMSVRRFVTRESQKDIYRCYERLWRSYAAGGEMHIRSLMESMAEFGSRV